MQFLFRLLEAWATESSDAELPVFEALEFLYEACAESRREFSYGEGVTLSTVHSAKGAEFDHVLLIGNWMTPDSVAKLEEVRRTFYVGMTRARKTLAICDRQDFPRSLAASLNNSSILAREFEQETKIKHGDWVNYETLGLEEIHLGFPGNFPPQATIHAALGRLKPGDNLSMRPVEGKGIGLFDDHNVCVARLSHKGESVWEERLTAIRKIQVLAMVHRGVEQDPEPSRRERYSVTDWEVPIIEVEF